MSHVIGSAAERHPDSLPAQASPARSASESVPHSCRRCGSSAFMRSRVRWYETWRKTMSKRPYRCRLCRHRSWQQRFAADETTNCSSEQPLDRTPRHGFFDDVAQLKSSWPERPLPAVGVLPKSRFSNEETAESAVPVARR
jgi:hypothetical protein